MVEMVFLVLGFAVIVAAVMLACWFARELAGQSRRLLLRLDSIELSLRQLQQGPPAPADGRLIPDLALWEEPSLDGRSPGVRYGRLTLRNGVRFRVAVDQRWFDPIISGVVLDETWVLDPFYPLLDLLKPGDRILDLGAHIGTFSLAAAALGCRVISVEAAPQNAELLNSSVRLNHFERMRVVQTAVTDHAGAVEFVPNGPWGTVANAAVARSPGLIQALNYEPVRVPATTVDELLANVGWELVDCLKMDIEGSEVAALRGMQSLLTRSTDLIVFYECNAHALRFFDHTPALLIRTLQAFGFGSYSVESESDGSHRLVPVQPDDFQPQCVANYLAIKGDNPRLSACPVRAPYSSEELIAQVLQHAGDRDWYNRAHVAEVLREAPAAITADAQVVAVLPRLAADADERVRKAAGWFAEART